MSLPNLASPDEKSRRTDTDSNQGGAAQKVGGPLDKDGAIGKNFNADRGDSKIGK